MIGVRSIVCALALALLVPFAGRAVDASPRGGTGANAGFSGFVSNVSLGEGVGYAVRNT